MTTSLPREKCLFKLVVSCAPNTIWNQIQAFALFKNYKEKTLTAFARVFTGATKTLPVRLNNITQVTSHKNDNIFSN
ncbi:hypothetical protein RIR_jg32035.t1 [Rhizophagus irregularis DAOM 181602=DAOM 197198]|nr:hypothetical protein RIR_jg32035.t1 [Rhizophagus irregularis DAOM 181602=DAOM 197198]CAB4375955.1 unnamed protein product [Rhizophagus irregularis]